MRFYQLLALACVSAMLSASFACKSRTAVPRNASRSDRTAPSAPPPDIQSLPEDPDAGARSLAQWQQHLKDEERERRLNYDRRKLPEHERIVKVLSKARRSYDRASTESAVRAAQAKFRSTVPGFEKTFTDIDHWGQSSKLLPDYRALVAAFSERYPAARVSALSGSLAAFNAITREVDDRFQRIDEWMREAADSEDE